MKPPAFQFYAADFLVGTATMTAEEVGAYIRLLCYQWDTGSIPDNDSNICRLGGCDASCIPAIRSKFYVELGVLKNTRMENERLKQAEYRAIQSGNGKAGANKRWHSGANGCAIATPIAKGMAKGMAKNSSPSPSPSPSPSSVSDSDFDNTLPAKPALRAPNVLFDALCEFEGIPASEVGSAGGRIGTALKAIRAITPDLTPEEIRRRGENYHSHFSGAASTAAALAKHWGKCHAAAEQHSGAVPWQRKSHEIDHSIDFFGGKPANIP